MGTRHLTFVINEGKTKVAQYGQWDGYPTGQGKTVLEFLQDVDIKEFKEKLKNVRFGTEDELQDRWVEAGASRGAEWIDLNVSKNMKDLYPELSRDTGATVLDIINKAERPILLNDSTGFAADGLFCEWDYVIDLDKNVLEVYKGFGHEPLASTERFAYLNESANKAHRDANTQYAPISKLTEFYLDALPELDEFVKEINILTGREEE